MIRFGLRLAVAGGREAVSRLAIVGAAVRSASACCSARSPASTQPIRLNPEEDGPGTMPLLRRITGPETARNE